MPAEIPAAFETGVMEPADATTGTAMDSPLELAAAPSSPYMLPPQQYAPPEEVTAHEWEPPADTDTAPVRVAWEPPMDAITVAGELVSTVPPLPIRPFAPRPQHLTRPDCSTAQVCEVPADTASAGSLPSSACTGVELEPVLPFPSSPFHPFPQHLTAPVVITAQVWFPPAVIETAPVSTSTGWTVITEEKLPIAAPL